MWFSLSLSLSNIYVYLSVSTYQFISIYIEIGKAIHILGTVFYTFNFFPTALSSHPPTLFLRDPASKPTHTHTHTFTFLTILVRINCFVACMAFFLGSRLDCPFSSWVKRSSQRDVNYVSVSYMNQPQYLQHTLGLTIQRQVWRSLSSP